MFPISVRQRQEDMKHDYTKYDEADKRVKTFITAFYAASDDPAKNEEWVAFFTPEAVVVMGDKTAKGVEDIRMLRKGMWEKVKSRRHDVEKVFLDPLFLELFEDERRIDYMLHGVVDLELKSGGEITRQWAARGVLREDEKGLKYTFYQVYFNN